MLKYLSTCVCLYVGALLWATPAVAATFYECQGPVTRVDDSLQGHSGMPGGLLLVSTSGSPCGEAVFWYEDDGVKTKNVMAIALTALAAGKQVRIVYDADVANYGSRGKIYRITVVQN